MYNYRCSRSKCRRRTTKKRKIETYKIRKFRVCPSCKNDSLKLDLNVKKDAKKNICHCDAFPYPHKIKSISENRVCKNADFMDIVNKELGAEKINSRIKEPF